MVKTDYRLKTQDSSAILTKLKGETTVEAARFGGGGIGFDWVCFFGVCKVVHFHNPLLEQKLCSFEHPANWVCFA